MPANVKLYPMATVNASPESVRLAKIAFGRPNWSEARVLSRAASMLGLRKASDYPYSPTRLLLQATHQVNTRT